MKWTVEGEHRRHYVEHGYVGFEELVAPDACDAALDENLLGRDLWRGSKIFHSISGSRRIAGLVAELTEVRRVRLAFDQLPMLGPVAQTSSVQGIFCALLLRLSPGASAADPLPTGQGAGIFFRPDLEVGLDDASYLLVAYARDPAIYVYNPHDPYTGQWKRLGLNYGDRLNEPLFPILAK